MKKILLHIGLPKTATTTLQANLFKTLHDESKINFIGRYMTVHSSEYYNPFGDFYSQYFSDDSYKQNIARYRKSFYKLLDKTKINVISEESLSLTHEVDFELVLKKLELLFHECDVRVIISLRNPIDFLFSYYVELYKWQFYKNIRYDTFLKFTAELRNNPLSTDFDILFFERFLFKIESKFKNISILLFEDITNDEDFYSQQLANILELSVYDIKTRLFKSKKNERIRTESGKFSEEITLDQKFFTTLNQFNTLKYFLSKLPGKNIIYKKLIPLFSKISVTKPIMHIYPNANDKSILLSLLSIKNSSFSNKYNLPIEKLEKYKYVYSIENMNTFEENISKMDRNAE